ncbi:MAG: phosphoenolpyruvate carboxykinase (ATP), partial [Bacteroidota bacterium]
MQDQHIINTLKNLESSLGLTTSQPIHWDLSPERLVEITLELNQGRLTDNGTLAINTGKFTGRSPKDRFIVRDGLTEDAVWWGDVNLAFSPETFDRLYDKMMAYASEIPLYVRDAYACASDAYRLPLRV